MKTIIILLVLMCSISSTSAQIHPQWGELKPGPHAVGYQVFHHYDYGRHIRPRLDFEGKENAGEEALPIQISMWYPAQASNTPKMRYEEYLYIGKQKNTFLPLSAEEKKAAGNDLLFPAKFGAGIDLSDDQLQHILQTPCAATQNAKNLKGPFPLIISGTDGGPHSNNILCEYLASLGYVVLQTPSAAHTSTLQANKPQLALAERMGNLEHLMAFAKTLSFVDGLRVGILGVNFDGMSALLYQMKNMQADAVVSLDGWEGKAGSKSVLFASPFFDANKMRVPYFTVQQDEKDPPPYLQPDQSVFDTFLYSDRYYGVLQGMNHAYLIANLALIPDLAPDKRKAYHFIFSSIGQFFEAYLKKSSTALAFIQQSALENGYPEGIHKVELKKQAFPAVPSPEEFEKIVMSGEMDKAMHILQEGKKNNPGLSLFDLQTLNLYAFRFTQRQQPETVRAIWQLGVEAFPNSAWAMEKLGDAHLVLSNKSDALHCFEKALALLGNDPASAAIAEKIKKLKEQ
ncbi:hypothetical protein [Haliscomenobacter hydrossis]|nr:hypothetical protein [Haliscomenobacter hydrossis]